MNIYEKLAAIQAELKAPKSQFNKFGGYNYRSCEDIVEAVKPLAFSHQTVLMLCDELVMIGERYYIKATATLHDLEDGGVIGVTSYAREEENKKGMDGSQVTGASSSYARKYALNGLFAIDDNKDSDTTNKHGKDSSEPTETKEFDLVKVTKQLYGVAMKIMTADEYKNFKQALHEAKEISSYDDRKWSETDCKKVQEELLKLKVRG